MKGIFSVFFIMSCLTSTFAQLNIELLAKRSYGNVRLSNIWGWTAPDSTEYALVGTQRGVSIVSLKDPRNPVEVKTVPGSNSIWRELKTWGNHAYVVTDQSGTSDGLLIIDLSKLPDSVSYTNWRPSILGLGTLSRSHTIFIDENGVCYLFGSNLNNGGAVMLDVKTNPNVPVYLGKGAPEYIHDGYARNNILYAGEIYDGRFSVYDVTDKNNVQLLASQLTPSRFTHNTWLSDDNKYLYTTDEVFNAPITAYDVSNLNDIKELNQFRRAETLNRGVVPHNVHVKGDFLVTAYYTDGVNILDATYPDKLIEVGHFDTYPGADGGFNGAWGVYPYFPSGNIVVSDIQNGLYVLKPTYKKAAILEGIVNDSISKIPLSDVQVVIQSPKVNVTQSNILGKYVTGQVLAGNFNVTFSKTGYFSKTVAVNLQNGVLTTLNVALVPFETYKVSGKAVAQTENNGIAGAKVWVINDSLSYTSIADAQGNFTFDQIRKDTYDIYVGAWGYRYKLEENILIDNNKTITLALTTGYEDNFTLELGWETAFRDASGGLWIRAIPVGTLSQGAQANPAQDLDNDIGAFCYLTGNGGGTASGDDVDGGPVALASPTMDLTSYENPILSYQLWFFKAGGGDTSLPDDSLIVRVTNGIDTVTVEKITDSKSIWRAKSSIRVADYLGITNAMKIIFETSDIGEASHIVEAAVDGFAVEEGSATAVEEPSLQTVDLQVFPNPFKDQLTVRVQMPGGTFQGNIRLLNALGQVIQTIPVDKNAIELTLEQSGTGIYFLQATSTAGDIRATVKVIKTE